MVLTADTIVVQTLNDAGHGWAQVHPDPARTL
jgi:hypothetical protein